MQVEEASREAGSLNRDAIKLVEACDALKTASQCLRSTAEALQRLRTARAHLEMTQHDVAASSTTTSELQAAYDAAKLAVVVAEGAVDSLEPSGVNFTVRSSWSEDPVALSLCML